MKNIITLAIVFYFTFPVNSQDVEPLKYNNPGLVVDLGLGLGLARSADVDGDGDLDLLVSCPDKLTTECGF